MKTELDFLKDIFLFRGMTGEKISSLISSLAYEIREYKRGELIYSPFDYKKEIGFVISGKCDISRQRQDGTLVTLNTITTGNSFGILAALSACEEYPTVIKAKSGAKIFFINDKILENLIRTSPEVSMNVISFLADRISFLNNKIATFSAGTVEEKIIAYILRLSRECNTLDIPFNCKHCSELINSGRASVYRVLDSLSNAGFITYENKKIYIKDLEGLERTKK